MHEKRAQLLRSELDRFVDVVSRELNPERIVLFGSFARGEVHEWSDLDLVVVMDTDLPFLQRLKAIRERVCPKVSTDVLVYTPSEWRQLTQERPFFRDEIVAKGKVIYMPIRYPDTLAGALPGGLPGQAEATAALDTAREVVRIVEPMLP